MLAGGWLNVVEQNEWKCLPGSWLEHLGRCSTASLDGADTESKAGEQAEAQGSLLTLGNLR